MHGIRRLYAAVIAASLLLISNSACALSPQAYLDVLTDGVNRYSGAIEWQRVAVILSGDGAELSGGDGEFVITDGQGNKYLSTGVAKLCVSGSTANGEVESIKISVYPEGRGGTNYDYQAFSLCEVAFKALIGRGADSDMCAYLFSYDVYPYALWARDSAFETRSRKLTAAIGGYSYSISSSADADDRSVEIEVRLMGGASEAERAAATANLNANYALESISALIYELDACRGSCAVDADASLIGDMRACVDEYRNLGANAYSKLSALTGALDKSFDRVGSAINDDALTQDDIDEIDSAVDDMIKALATMY